MTVTAAVTDILTEGYIEAASWVDGKLGPDRCIAGPACAGGWSTG